MPVPNDRIKKTVRFTPSLMNAIHEHHQVVVAEHRAGPDYWRRTPGENEVIERLLADALKRAKDDRDAMALAAAEATDPKRHGRKLKALNAARAPRRTIKRGTVRK